MTDQIVNPKFIHITSHPQLDDIISRLLNGNSPGEVALWLRMQYPETDQSHLRLSEKLLKEFSKSPLMDLNHQHKDDLAKLDSGGQINKKIAASLLNNKTYQERLNEFADEQMDLKKELMELGHITKARMIQIFDKIQEDPEDLGSKGDYKFIKYMEQFIKVMDTYDKSVNNRPDQVIQHNYTMEYIDKRTQLIQDTITETLDELDPEITFMFMSKMQEKLSGLEFKETKENAFPPNLLEMRTKIEMND